MGKMDGMSMDLLAENIAQLKMLFPEAVTEGKVDFEVLKALLGGEIEKQQEYYKFTWNGKEAARAYARTRSMGTLRPCIEESSGKDGTPGKFDSDNLYIEGDNLEVLKLLQGPYHKRVKMIYIDPPYNTGKDFVYPDNFRDSIGNYKALTGQTDDEGKATRANPETSGRYHTDWLNMMYPRLILARNLLTDDGVIFISIDDNEVDNLKKLCNEVFGEENFIGLFCRKTKSGGGSAAGSCAVEHDYVLSYAKTTISHALLEKFDAEYLERYKECDEKGHFFWDTMERSSTATTPYLITAPDGQLLEGKWFRSKKTFEEDKKTGEVRFLKKNDGTWSVQFKQRLAEGKKLRTILETSDLTDKKYRSLSEELSQIVGCSLEHPPKPLTLMQTLVNSIMPDKNALILDFFSGSATTAHAVQQLNAEDGGSRKYIMVQLPEICEEGTDAAKAGYANVCEIGKERIRRAAKKIKAENTLFAGDMGFKVFKLDTSNMRPWNPNAEELEQNLFAAVDNVLEGRSTDDLLYEVMLKCNLPLTLPIEKKQCGNNTIYLVGAGALAICLDKAIPATIAEEIVRLRDEYAPIVPMQVVFRDNGFNDVTKTNALQILKQAGFEEKSIQTI